MLARELKMLKDEGLLTAENDDQAHILYELTQEGKSLLQAAEPLMEWSVVHAGKPFCAPEQQCSHCMDYPATIGAPTYIRMGKRDVLLKP